VNSDPLASSSKASAGFDLIHLAIAATKRLAEAKPQTKVKHSWSYAHELPSPFKALRPLADQMVSCPYCSSRGPRSQLTSHIKNVHYAPPVDPMAPCPHCAAKVRQSNLGAHIAKVHQAQLATTKAVPAPVPPTVTRIAAPKPKAPTAILAANRPSRTDLTVCPICNVSVRSDRLDRHRRKIHEKTQGKPARNRQSSIQLINSDSKQLSAFAQAFHEAQFGNKYVGHMRRQSSGRFGSLPLYDDYGDDADAD
jgi:uncharacterized protein with PIN domain